MPLSISLWMPLTAIAILSLALTFLCHLCARRILSRAIPQPSSLPPISILKPLKGVDDGLYLNLCSFAQLEYPVYEVICGAEDIADPALEIARRVQREFPEARIRIVQCRGARGLNPKVRSLQTLAREARYEHLLISDSNVRVDASWLRDTAAELADPRVGLVTNPIAPLASANETLGALFDNLHLGAFVFGSIAASKIIAHRACVVGKSMLLSKSALARVGGLRSVRNMLAEDYLLGRKFELAGYRVALSPHPIMTINESCTIEKFVSRHLRWGQMRRRISLGAYTGEVLLNPILWIALAFAARPDSTSFALAIGGAAIKCLLDRSLLQRLRRQPLPLFDSIWIPIKDLLIAAIWPIAALKRTLDWRGNAMRIGNFSRLFPLAPIDVPEANASVGEEVA